MITNHGRCASTLPKHGGSRLPKTVSLGLQLSSGAQFAHQRQNDEQRQFANSARTVLKREFRVLRGSQRGHVNGYDANFCASVTVKQRLADLAALADRIVVSLASRCGLMATGSSIREQRHDFELLRHGLHAGDECCGVWAHVGVSLFGEYTLGPMALHVKREIA